MILIFTDGASRGNPGPAACAFVIKNDDNTMLASSVCYLGITTNNVAEYTAIIQALMWAIENDAHVVQVFSDSELVIRQLTGVYRIYKPHLKSLFDEIMKLTSHFSSITFTHVPRTHPDIRYCDQMCNEELDRHNRQEKQHS